MEDLEEANQQILNRIGVLSAVASLTPTLFHEFYDGDFAVDTFQRQVILGDANGPFLNFVRECV